jgi:FAD/FMN-containing dehydrogenase/Fe-S oxidoreductase
MPPFPEAEHKLRLLGSQLSGELFFDEPYRLMYATDASIFRELPLAVARPGDKQDLLKLVRFASENGIPLIPRTAGTSLAGQVVGQGIVIDFSRHMNRILELNAVERWVRVEPGVVLDELNKYLEPHGLFFGPETSTSNRCMIGGMIGNNACGAHSVIYGSTRDHLLSLSAILSDGSEAEFGMVGRDAFMTKCNQDTLEGSVYRNIHGILSDKNNQEEIRKEYPDPSIRRRNTGYAIDLLLETEPFTSNGIPFNFSKLLAGSEGTLALLTEARLNLVPLPPKEKALVCAHFDTLEDALQANLIALRHKPGAVELMDRFILDCTKDNIEQRKNRYFIEGDPGAILIIEFARESMQEIRESAAAMESRMREAGLGYHFPLITGNDIARVWALRKAGLGVLSNVPGDAKPVSVIEDTAVSPENLPGYIAEFKTILEKRGLSCVYHAHVATGELHLRPLINLKDPKDVRIMRELAREIALLVKRYRGSLSGEHGDGRVRGEFIPLMIGKKNYSHLESIKKTWDPGGIFNPGKITAAPPMNESLRYKPGRPSREIATVFDFSRDGGILRAIEKCNGSGDCRKSAMMGGTMCPSFMATRDENTTTRARANILREFLSNTTKKNPFNQREIKDILDLCLSCKGCKSECPSNVDMARYKAEFLQHYYESNGIPFRTLAIGHIAALNRLGSHAPAIFNALAGNRVLSGVIKKALGFTPNREIPKLSAKTLRSRHIYPRLQPEFQFLSKVHFFADEFTNYNEAETGMKAIALLNALGYEVVIPRHVASGRAQLSKGLVKSARKLARKNVNLLSEIVDDQAPLVGLEPSAVLSFRDEYPDLVGPGLREAAVRLSGNCLLIDEFIAREAESGRISSASFTDAARKIKLHGHCHQKALSSSGATKKMLSLPVNYQVEEIQSGCCGMAGSFGYEKEHYQLSMQVGELVLFPEIRKTPQDVIIAAPGTSCRTQIKDGTGRTALHPVEILFEALLPELLRGLIP